MAEDEQGGVVMGQQVLRATKAGSCGYEYGSRLERTWHIKEDDK